MKSRKELICGKKICGHLASKRVYCMRDYSASSAKPYTCLYFFLRVCSWCVTWRHEIHAQKECVGTMDAHVHNTTFSGCLFIYSFIFFLFFCFVFLTSSHPMCLSVWCLSIYLSLPSRPLDVFMSVCLFVWDLTSSRESFYTFVQGRVWVFNK